MNRDVCFDDEYNSWNVGDIVVWAEDKDGPRMQITKILRGPDYVYWNQSEAERGYYDNFVLGKEAMTRITNVLRVRKVTE